MRELLKTANPDLLKEWDYEKNAGIDVDAIRVNASNKIFWKCLVDPRHRWVARVSNRAIDGNGCPYCSGRKTLREESFGALFPEIASQLHPTKNRGFDPFAISPGSNKVANWICEKGHVWSGAVHHRVISKSGCRICSYVSKRPTLVQSPLALEFHPTKNGERKVEFLTLGSRERVWWQCAVDPTHEWQEAINYRVKTGKGCPKCYPRITVRRGTLDGFSEILCQEWHPTLNGDLTPKDVTIGASRKVWWQCSKSSKHPAWSALVRNRTINRQGCPKCAFNAFDEERTVAKKFPKLAAEWHPTKNGLLTPSDVTIGSARKVWWRCSINADHEWQSIINVRTKRNTGCPLCMGRSVTRESSLAVRYPKIAVEWHPHKNGDLTSEGVKAKSGKKVWWRCELNPLHEWQAQIKNRTINGSGCPDCARENNVLKIQVELDRSAFNTTDVYRIFLHSIRNLEYLAKAPPAKPALRTLFFRMLYAQTITALEAYLADAFLKLVVRNPPFKKRLLGEAGGFKEKKFTLAEILESNPTSDEAIAIALSEISWHHIPRAKTLFAVVCGVAFVDDIYPLLKAVSNRHDIVHRNGKSTQGRGVAIGAKEVFELFTVVKDFVRDLDGKLSLIGAQEAP